LLSRDSNNAPGSHLVKNLTMNKKQSQPILTRNPQLESLIKQGKFLTGYSQGGQAGELISIFVCHSPWTTNCLQATAGESIEAGEIIVVSDDWPWSLSGSWKAYSRMLGD